MSHFDFQDIILDHYSRYPQMQLKDLYKLVHQAAMGSEHAVKDIQSARQWLEREIEILPGHSDEPVIDPITPDQSLVRVHLKPYLDSGGDPESLLRSFIRTANEYQGSKEVLKQYWECTKASTNQGDLPFTPGDLDSLFNHMASLDFPAVHHSEQYQVAYAPHYRVLYQGFLIQ